MFKKYGKHPAIKAFVDGVTAAAIGAIAGAVSGCVLGGGGKGARGAEPGVLGVDDVR